jgi:hypothetical protein
MICANNLKVIHVIAQNGFLFAWVLTKEQASWTCSEDMSFVYSYSYCTQYTANAQGAVTGWYSFSVQGYLADRMHAAVPVFWLWFHC